MAGAAGGQQPMKRPRPTDISGSIVASVPAPLPTLDLIRAARLVCLPLLLLWPLPCSICVSVNSHAGHGSLGI
jgi:hypothetical protein